MPDSFGPAGLTVQTASELTSNLVAGLQGIYGADINVDQNSPDGETIGILTEGNVDIRELLVSVNAGFDPDQAQGVVLDQRVALNNIQRQGGTYTIQPVDITVNATVNLQGLDANFSNPLGTGYSVQDGQGNEFILIDSVTLMAGTTTVDFRAQQIGAVNVPIGTITNPITVIPGVVSVNNSVGAVTVGQTQETDAQLRTRRAASVRNTTNGYLNGLRGLLLDLPGVTEAQVYQNVGSATDVNGIPGKSIWPVVAGGANTDIANTIYGKLSGGTGMYGTVSVPILQPEGTTLDILFDRPEAQNLYIKFTIKTTTPGYDFDTDAIQNYLESNLVYGIGAFAETSAITTQAIAAIAAQGGGGVPVLMSISNDNATWTDYLVPSTLKSQWTVSAENITILIVT